ncbi:MAG: hypothetical protein NC218_00990 [Acetobacter sp.]|nr:hypothetical protein [Acetobacter sp.]
MLAILLSSLIINTEANQPTKVYGSAATQTGEQNTVSVTQPENMQNPFGYIAPESITSTQQPTQTPPQTAVAASQNQPVAKLLTTQSSTVNPTDMNPLDYTDKIENTVYQSGDRLIFIQSIPLKYIKEATEPNIQPTISDFPSF